MVEPSVKSPNCNKTDKFGISLSIADDDESMVDVKRDRKLQMLEFLAEHDLALPPKAIFRNLRLNHRITFSENTMNNYLDDCVDEGKVLRVDPKELPERNIQELPEDSNRRAYYLISDKGKAFVRDELDK